MHVADDEHRRAFSAWLRTGRWPLPPSGNLEFKFNPWHDPEDGRFTFAGTGRYYGRSGSDAPTRRTREVESGEGMAPLPPRKDEIASVSQSPAAAAAASPSRPAAQSQATAARSSTQDRWTGGGFTGGGGGSFGGGGATATGTWPDAPKRPTLSRDPAVSKRPNQIGDAAIQASAPSRTNSGEQFRTIVRNGYTYHTDARERTRRVSGELTVAASIRRSRKTQGRAGGTDRRATDDGGHYIAARFNGPTEAFNHFAQDLNFNRGGYRLLEDQWAKAKNAGKKVTVTIVPRYNGASVRPSVVDVSWVIDGKEGSLKFHNERVEKSRGKR